MHTLMDLRGSIPCFICITEGKTHDVNVLDEIILESNAFYIMDRAYTDFKRLYALSQNMSFFVNWIAIIVYVLVAIMKKTLKVDRSLMEIMQILSIALFEKTRINQALESDRLKIENDKSCKQLNLFDF